jgi:ribosomal protein L29
VGQVSNLPSITRQVESLPHGLVVEFVWGPGCWESAAMKSADYRGMSDEQLALSLKEVVKNLFHLRFQSATERLETPSEIHKAKREVARIQTIQRERQLKIDRSKARKAT